MAYNRLQASRLLSRSEMEVFLASLSDRLAALTAAEVRAMIRRARAMRDRAQDLVRRQALEAGARTGSRTGASGQVNRRSAEKLTAMSQALKRFEERSRQLDLAKERAARKTAAAAQRLRLSNKRSAAAGPARQAGLGPEARGRRSPREDTPAGRKSESAREARPSMRFKAAGNQRIQAHISSAGRRSQARRDGRG